MGRTRHPEGLEWDRRPTVHGPHANPDGREYVEVSSRHFDRRIYLEWPLVLLRIRIAKRAARRFERARARRVRRVQRVLDA